MTMCRQFFDSLLCRSFPHIHRQIRLYKAKGIVASTGISYGCCMSVSATCRRCTCSSGTIAKIKIRIASVIMVKARHSMCVCTHAAYRNAVAMDWHFIDRLRSPFPHITNAIWLHVVVSFTATSICNS